MITHVTLDFDRFLVSCDRVLRSTSVQVSFDVSVTVMISSVLSLTTISVNRYVGINHAGFAKMERKRPFLILATIWIVSMGAALPSVAFTVYFVSVHS